MHRFKFAFVFLVVSTSLSICNAQAPAAGVAPQMDFAKMRDSMIKSTQKDLAEKNQQRNCMQMTAMPQDMQAKCAESKRQLFAELNREIKMSNLVIECLKKSSTFPTYQACFQDSMKAMMPKPDAAKPGAGKK